MQIAAAARMGRDAGWTGYLQKGAIAAVLVFTIGQAYVVIDAHPEEIPSGIAGILDILRRGSPPDTSVLGDAIREALTTVDVAIIGTLIPIVFSLPLAFLAAENMRPNRIAYAAARGVVAVCRTVPDIIWALLFVAAVGLGPFPAALGLAVHSIGILGRLYAEAIEDVNMASIEALQAIGANRVQIAAHAVLPAVLPTMTGLTLYRMDTNVRSSLVLGFVGGGGLGFGINTALSLFEYKRLLTYLLVMGVLIAGVEVAAVALRRRIH
jgi:phosphonate transport system permease protein